MAKYALHGGENVGTIAIEDQIGESLPDLDLGLAKADGDYLDQLDQMSRQMDRGDTIVDTKLGVIDLDDFLGKVEILRAPLEEARRLIGEEMYEEALEQLRGILTSPSGPHEAVYLIGLCHYHLGATEEALGALLPLKAATLEAGVAKPFKQLKHQIRKEILAIVVIENMLLVRNGQPEKPIERLRRLTRLDPPFGLFHFLLAGNLMTADLMEEALDAAEVGLRESDPEHRKQLEGLKDDIVRRLLEVKMEKARTHYHDGKYPKARSALESLDARYQESRLWITFFRYLGELSLSRGKKPQDVKPTGQFKDVDALHFFLVRNEIAQAKLAISIGMLGPAMSVLDLALSYTPHFPYIHFLTALCIYQRTGKSLGSDNPPSPDDALENLNTALKHAREGAKDKEIGSAKELQGAIKSAIEVMGSAKEELETRRQEAQRVNVVIEDYQAVMELVGDGISSPEQWREVCTEMGKVKKKIGSIRGKVTRSEGKEVLDHLEGVVDNSVEQLEALGSKITEAETIKGAVDEFNAIMSSAEGGLSSRDAAKRLQGRLEKLGERVDALPIPADKDAKKALRQLQKAINRTLRKIIKTLRKEPKGQKEAKEFNELAQEFQGLMESTERTPPSNESELLDFMVKLGSISSRAMALKDRIKDREGKKAAEQLIQAITNVFGQLRT